MKYKYIYSDDNIIMYKELKELMYYIWRWNIPKTSNNNRHR